MKKTIIILLIFAVVIIAVSIVKRDSKPADAESTKKSPAGGVYATWQTMEFDKCVSAWLITRYINPKAEFRFYPSGTEITDAVAFDVPGADWSRKHLKCTSQCILEDIDVNDPAVERIVSIASKVELNFWQLDRWPEAQRRYFEVKEIMEGTDELNEIFIKTGVYFDALCKEYSKAE